MDCRGRAFLTVAHNRFERNGVPIEEKDATLVELDIEGQTRAVIDALGRTVACYDYDMLGARIHQTSMEAGERWMFSNAAGLPIRTWNCRNHEQRMTYDPLRRHAQTFLREGTAGEQLIARAVYGEAEPDAESWNLRGRLVRRFDQAGLVTSAEYDFKGNALSNERRLAREYRNTLDWATDPALEPEAFVSRTDFDALNRPVAATAPDQSLYRASFDEANRPVRIDVHLRGAAVATSFVSRVEYDAIGRRQLIEYGSGVKSTHDYDPETFRLTRLRTTRSVDPALLQDLSYTHDPGGNIVHIHDGALQTIYFSNQVVAPDNDYTYDAVYRLVRAAGREHIGQVSQPQTSWDDAFRTRIPAPTDGQALRSYTEQYEYDAVGNFLQLIHQATNGNWRRAFSYAEQSTIEPAAKSNRLSATSLGPTSAESYAYDVHGNMTSLPHLTLMQWDYADQLRATSRQSVSDGVPEITYYVYDYSGRRVRKVTERPNGTRRKERIDLGGFEKYREYGANGTDVTLERDTLHVVDDRERVALVETLVIGDGSGSESPVLRYQMSSHLGSSALELDETGQVISYEEYYPFGSTSHQAGRNLAQVSTKRYRYAGQERDEESGLYYNLARYYAPWLSRWLACDPIGIADHPNLYLYARGNPVSLTDRGGENPGEVADLEGQLRAVREQLGKLEKKYEQLVERRAMQEANVEISTRRIAEAKRSYTEAEIRQIEKGELKALEQGSGKRGIVKDLERWQKKLEEANTALAKTKGELKTLESVENDATKRMTKLTNKVRKAGGNPYVGTDDPAMGHATAESAAEAEAAATNKVKPVGGKKAPGGGGAAGAKGGSGPSDPWAKGGGGGGGGRAATATEEIGEAGSRFARFGKTMKVLKFGGKLAFVVTAGIAAGHVVFHLYKGQYREAAMDVADFFTVGGASYVTEKTVEAVQDLNEGMEAARRIRDWNEEGAMPPPQPGESTQEQREEYYERRKQSHREHPFGF
jgi:RHS repeat-associated protein